MLNWWCQASWKKVKRWVLLSVACGSVTAKKLVKSSPRPDEGPCPDRASSEQLSFDVPRYLGFFDLYLQTQLWALSSLSPLGSVECGCRPLGHNTEARGLHQAKQGMRIPPRFWRVVMVERKNLSV